MQHESEIHEDLTSEHQSFEKRAIVHAIILPPHMACYQTGEKCLAGPHCLK